MERQKQYAKAWKCYWIAKDGSWQFASTVESEHMLEAAEAAEQAMRQHDDVLVESKVFPLSRFIEVVGPLGIVCFNVQRRVVREYKAVEVEAAEQS